MEMLRVEVAVPSLGHFVTRLLPPKAAAFIRAKRDGDFCECVPLIAIVSHCCRYSILSSNSSNSNNNERNSLGAAIALPDLRVRLASVVARPSIGVVQSNDQTDGDEESSLLLQIELPA